MAKFKINRQDESSIVVGAFYQVPCGEIAYIYGYGHDVVSYYFDGKDPAQTDASTVISSWVRRDDLSDFPNALDPRLPYSFDLFWDIKRMSELTHILKTKDHENYAEIKQMALENGLI